MSSIDGSKSYAYISRTSAQHPPDTNLDESTVMASAGQMKGESETKKKGKKKAEGLAPFSPPVTTGSLTLRPIRHRNDADLQVLANKK